MVRTLIHSSFFIGGMITALVLMGCSNFSDLAFQENTLSPNDSSSQNSVSSSAKLYLDRLAGKLLFTDTVNAGNTNTISVNLAEDLYYYDTKTTHTYGDAFILMLEP